MEADPYYLKDTEGDYYNQYPEFQIWEEGRQAGQDDEARRCIERCALTHQAGRQEVVEWIAVHKFKTQYLEGDIMVAAEDWLEQLKEWGLK